MIGTFVNFVTVIIGSLFGLAVGNRLSEKIKSSVIIVIGLMTIAIGISSALTTANVLIPLLALVLGTIIGELIDIDRGINWLGDWLKQRFDRSHTGEQQNFTKAFVIASLQFCVGPLTILGSINDGISGDYSLLAIKAVLDGFSAIIFASTFGIGTIFAGATILIFQGSITLGAGLLKPLLISDPTLTMSVQPRVIELAATGGVILLGLALNILDLKHVRVANMLPALIIAPLLVALLQSIGIPLDFGLGGR